MKITAVKTIGLRWECPVMSDAMSVCRARQALWIKIETDTEIYGIGEAFCYGSPLVIAKHIVEDQLAPAIIGEDPENIELLWQRMYWRNVPNGRTGLVMGCISGIDIALWDILGKAAKMPVSKLLGAHSDRVPAYASGGFYALGKDLDGLKKEVEGYLKKGYQDVKIKIGRNPEIAGNAVNYTASTEFAVSYDEDIRRIAATRELVGPRGRVAADINAAWPVETVLNAVRDFRSAGLSWLEEPILFEDEEGLKQLRTELMEIALMGYETTQGCKNFGRLLKENAMDIVQPDIGWGGGFSELRKIGLAAQSFSKPVSLHSFGSCVHFAASLQLAGSLPNTEAIESEENQNILKTGVLKTPFEHDEYMNFYVPQLPGLGIEIDWDAAEKIRVF